MSNSDIIAIVAIVVSGITTIATLIFGYFTNRSNNRAKLDEILYNKQLDALKDVYDSANRISSALFGITMLYTKHNKGDSTIISAEDELYNISRESYDIFTRNEVYLPDKISSALSSVSLEMANTILLSTPSSDKSEIIRSLSKQNTALIDILQSIKKELHRE